MIGLQKEIMPHVRFEQKDWGRNEQASKESGVHVPMRATFIIITSHGSKDAPEFIADEWLARKREDASRGNYNPDWVTHFQKQYDAWKAGHELPREGTPVLTWQAISQDQNVRLRALGYQVVEDVAALPDNALGALGLDGRVIRDLARAWLNEGKDKGINARELADTKAKVAAQDLLIENLQEQLNALTAKKQKAA